MDTFTTKKWDYIFAEEFINKEVQMIEFKGKLSYREVAWQLKWTEKYAGVGLLFAGVIIAIDIVSLICVALNLLELSDFMSYFPYVTGTIIISIILIIYQFMVFHKGENFSTDVKIDGEMIYCERGYHFEPYVTIPVSEVKKVKESKTCYYIIYKNFTRSIICQKDLITQGSIEEFEEIFKDKLIPAKK